MFTNESLFTIQRLLYQDSTVFMSLFDCCTELKALFGFQFRLFMSFSYAMQCVPNYGQFEESLDNSYFLKEDFQIREVKKNHDR